MILALIRHGQTDYNQKQLIQGHIDNPLNETGRTQAKEFADTLIELDITYDNILSSPLKRAFETADIIREHINHESKVIVNPILIERRFGKFDGLTIQEAFPIIEKNIQSDDYESDEDLVKRVIDGIFELEKTYGEQHLLAVTHSQVIKAIYVYLNPKKYTFTNFTIHNAELVCFKVSKNKIKPLDE
ncbi:MAG: histidine phosphatase family protein [Acholeplasmataceae bacterium]